MNGPTYSAAYRLALDLLRSEAPRWIDADELAHDAAVVTILRGPDRWEAYATACARNMMRRRFRGPWGAQRQRPFPDDLAAAPDYVADAVEVIVPIVLDADASGLLRRRYLDGETIQGIAAADGATYDAVKQRIVRARRRVRSALDGEARP